MASHVSDTWQAMCHNAWKRHACVTHGKPCVRHMACHVSTCMLTMKAIKMGMGSSFQTAAASVRGSSKEEEEGKRRRRRKGKGGKGRRKGGKERRKERRKEKRKGEEKRKKKKEKEEGVLRSEQTRMAKNPELRYKR